MPKGEVIVPVLWLRDRLQKQFLREDRHSLKHSLVISDEDLFMLGWKSQLLQYVRRHKEKMSCDFGVWYPYERLSNAEALQLYRRLCDGELDRVRAHPAVEAFYSELTAMHPEIDMVDDDRIDDHDYCPWSCALDYSPGHVIMACVWSKADYVGELVRRLAFKHGLAIYDPQSDCITYPDSEPAIRKRSWWRFW